MVKLKQEPKAEKTVPVKSKAKKAKESKVKVQTTFTNTTNTNVVKTELDKICEDLQNLQRKRTVLIKSRIMQSNRLKALVAGTIGYSTEMSEEDRRKKFEEADALIKKISTQEENVDNYVFYDVVKTTLIGIDAFEGVEEQIAKVMITKAKLLPVAAWIDEENQLGFGLLSLAVVVGETGNLCNYSTPAKVWKRMGLMPVAHDGEVKAPSTWRYGKEGKLPSEVWEKVGYSPRRRSVMYVIGENLIKQNMMKKDANGRREPWEYRKKYIEAKVTAKDNHPDWDWKDCTKCKGTGEDDSSAEKLLCQACGGSGNKCMRAHKHGMLVASKRLLRNLWCKWNGKPQINQLT